MVRQQLYRINQTGGRTIAVSEELSSSAWLSLLEERLSLIDYSALPAPVYFQYPLGRGIVLSRCSVNPYTPEKSYIAHQLVIDDPSDIDELTALRPMKGDLLPLGIFGCAERPDVLDSLSVQSLCDPALIQPCRETLIALFGNDEALLGRFLSAVSLCARDKRHTVRVLLDDEPGMVSESARRIMEMTLRAIPREDVLRISFCSLTSSASAGMQYTVSFMQKTAKNMPVDPYEIRFDLTDATVICAEQLILPNLEQHTAQACALIAGKDTADPRFAPTLPPFEAGMSIGQYFADWRSTMEETRAHLTDEAFRAYAARQWPHLITSVITASDRMDNARFLSELNDIITQIRREKLEIPLSMSNNTLTDLLIILLDSINWRQTDLARPQTSRLIRTVCSYSQVLTEEECPAECLCACRVVYCVLASPASVHEALTSLRRLEAASAAQFEAVQDCLRQYVEKRLTSDIDVIDEALTAAAMLGFARFSEGIPDLRLTDKLTERIDSLLDARSARRFEYLLDKLRSHLHSAPVSLIHRRDMKLFLLISCLLLILIAAITFGFLLLY